MRIMSSWRARDAAGCMFASWSERVPVVAVDTDPERIDTLLGEFGESLIVVVGDALEEGVLRTAGLDRARGAIAPP